MSVRLSGPMLLPAAGGAPHHLVVLLHGYGADGNDLIDLGRYWSEALPHAQFVAPDAPTPCGPTAPGYQWFPIGGPLPIRRVAEAPAARAAIVALLEELWAATGLGPGETVLVGFSQGAMMALHAGLSLPDRLAGIVAFSGALIPPEGLEQGALPKPKVALLHGALDGVVAPELSGEAATTLTRLGYEVHHHVSPGTGHGIAPDMLAAATAFLLEWLGAAKD